MKLQELCESTTFKQWAAENKAKLKALKVKKPAAEKPAKKSKAEHREHLDTVLLSKVEAAISTSFPDGDPMDHFINFLEHHNLSIKDVDRVMRKRYGTSYNGYLVSAWADTARDNISDAKRELAAGKQPHHSAFYTVKDGKVVAEPNPWK